MSYPTTFINLLLDFAYWCYGMVVWKVSNPYSILNEYFFKMVDSICHFFPFILEDWYTFHTAQSKLKSAKFVEYRNLTKYPCLARQSLYVHWYTVSISMPFFDYVNPMLTCAASCFFCKPQLQSSPLLNARLAWCQIWLARCQISSSRANPSNDDFFSLSHHTWERNQTYRSSYLLNEQS